MYERFVNLVTPFDVDNKIDYFELFKLIDYQLENEIDGIILLGYLSEMHSLTSIERLELINRCIKYINYRTKIIVGIPNDNINEILYFLEKIKDVEVDYFLIEPPYFCLNDDVGISNYLTYLADNVSKPLLVKNYSMTNSVHLNSDVITHLSYHKNIGGIIYNNGCLKEVVNYSKLKRENFKVYCGNDNLILQSLVFKDSGIVSMVGTAYPKRIKEICDYFNINNQVAVERFIELSNIIEDLSVDNSIVGLKYLISLLGFNFKKVRMPLGECSKQIKRKIEEDCLDL